MMELSSELPQPRAQGVRMEKWQGFHGGHRVTGRGGGAQRRLEAPRATVPDGATTPCVSLVGLLMPGPWGSEVWP